LLFHDWRAKFYFNAFIAAAVALGVYFLLQDTPQSRGLPPVEQYRNDYPPGYSEAHERTLGFREILFGCVLRNRYLWAIAVANAFCYFVRYGVENWIPTYLETAKGFSFKESSIGWSLYEWAAIPGTIACGWIGDRRRLDRRPLGMGWGVHDHGRVLRADHLLQRAHPRPPGAEREPPAAGIGSGTLDAVARQRLSEGLTQASQPGLVVTPLVQTLAVDRLADLLRARGTHAAFGPVELDARGLEFELAIVEQAANIAFQVIHQVLVLHAQHPPGQDGIPVPHELQVGTVVARDVFDAVGEFLAVREQLLEVTETAGHRLAPRVDDPGVGQHQVDESEVPEIVRHLVDEACLAGAVDTCIAQVLLAEAAKIRGTHLRQHRRVARVVEAPVTALQVHHDAREIGELVRAFDRGV